MEGSADVPKSPRWLRGLIVMRETLNEDRHEGQFVLDPDVTVLEPAMKISAENQCRERTTCATSWAGKGTTCMSSPVAVSVRSRRTLPRPSLACMMLLVLATLVAGCTTPSSTTSTRSTRPPTTSAHSFAGSMSVFHVPTPYTLPGRITAGPDGALWFAAIAYSNFGTNRPSGAIGRVTSAGVMTLFPLPSLNSYPRQVTLGPDGNLWFTALQGSGTVISGIDTPPKFSETAGEIGSITPLGTFSPFLARSARGIPDGIATGPDGNLWFTESVKADPSGSTINIARMSPIGMLTEFPLSQLDPLAAAAPSITAGPDGNLWFTIQSSAGSNAVCRVGRITPQGTITLFTPSGLYIAGDITNGPDGNLWISSGYYVARIAPEGQVSEYSLPGQGFGRASAGGITAGSDNALWFATDGSYVGRIAPDGIIKAYTYPPALNFDNGRNSLEGSALQGITTASDGTLWLTDDTQIGHFV